MRQISYEILQIMILLLLCGCSALNSAEWQNRKQDEEYVTFTEDTVAFSQENDSSGRTCWMFRTNDIRYILPEGDTLWRITDSSASVSVSAAACRNLGDASAGYGIVFAARKKAGQTYLLCIMINTLQQYSICKYSAGEYSEIQGWTHSHLLKGGYGIVNRIGVEYVASSQSFTLSLNGGRETSFRDTETPRLSTGASGYAVTISPYEGFPEKSVEVVFYK